MSMGPPCLFWWIFVEHLNPILYIPNTFASKLMLSNKQQIYRNVGGRLCWRGKPGWSRHRKSCGDKGVFSPTFFEFMASKTMKKTCLKSNQLRFRLKPDSPLISFGGSCFVVVGARSIAFSGIMTVGSTAGRKQTVEHRRSHEKRSMLPTGQKKPSAHCLARPSPPPRRSWNKSTEEKKGKDIMLTPSAFLGGEESWWWKFFWAGQKPWVDLIADLKALVTKNHSYSWLTFQDFFFFSNIFPDAPCMEYLPTFTIDLSQMKVNMPVPWGIWVLVCKILSGISGSIWYFNLRNEPIL